MERYTDKDVRNAFALLIKAMGARIATNYEDVGGYTLEHGLGGYIIGRIENARGGTGRPLEEYRLSAREFVSSCRFARDVLDAAVKEAALKPGILPIVDSSIDIFKGM